MKKIFLLVGILFVLANDAYSSDETQHNPLTSIGIPTPQEVDGNQKSNADIEDYLPEGSERIYDDSPEWYWANGEPLSELENTDMPHPLEFPDWIQKDNIQVTPHKKASEVKSTKDEMFLIADHVSHSRKKDIFWAWGRVKIRLEESTIQADKVKIINKTGEGIAQGHVIITNKDGTHLKALKSRFNIKNEEGKLFQTRGRLGENYYIKSRELTQIEKNHYQTKTTSITTCEGKLPDWLFEAESMDIIVGDRAVFTGGVFKVRNIPVFYIPAGYLPINQDRKSGFLFPELGDSDIDGPTFNNAYYWAINDHSDATFKLGYMGRRGFTPEAEYRYTPSPNTKGIISGSFIDDKVTRSTFWKIDANHEQELPMEFEFKGTLDLESAEFNRTFNDNINERARRNTDSFATISKKWETNTLDILTRYRDSTEPTIDETLAELPRITFNSQRQEIGDETGFYFNQETSFTSFLTDLDPDPTEDDSFSVQRFDFHPQFTYSTRITPWLSFTPTLGLRETIYSKGLDTTNNNRRIDFFTRESLDVFLSLTGPRFEKIYNTKNKHVPKIKHLIEPSISFSYIPEVDKDDRNKIRIFDGVDSVSPQSLITYSLTHRLLQKEDLGRKEKPEDEFDDGFDIRDGLRFTVSQSYDLREATKTETANNPRQPFSDVRFDLDSRLTDELMVNIDSTFDINDNVLRTFNFEVGFKPIDSLYFLVERRFTRRGEVFTLASLDWDFNKGWNLKASTRLDEDSDTNRENNISLLYDDPCKCWGFKLDYIQRDNFTDQRRKESKFNLGITFRGLGSIKSGDQKKLLHREFESIYE